MRPIVQTYKQLEALKDDNIITPDTIAQPKCILAEMRSYQLEGLNWLLLMHANGMNPILGDEMGLGKTLQTISFLATLKFELGVGGPHLVVVPLSVINSWLTEFKKWCPELRVVR